MTQPPPPVVDEVLLLTARIRALLEQIEAVVHAEESTEGDEDE